jgi:hypothetical protein
LAKAVWGVYRATDTTLGFIAALKAVRHPKAQMTARLESGALSKQKPRESFFSELA